MLEDRGGFASTSGLRTHLYLASASVRLVHDVTVARSIGLVIGEVSGKVANEEHFFFLMPVIIDPEHLSRIEAASVFDVRIAPITLTAVGYGIFWKLLDSVALIEAG